MWGGRQELFCLLQLVCHEMACHRHVCSMFKAVSLRYGFLTSTELVQQNAGLAGLQPVYGRGSEGEQLHRKPRVMARPDNVFFSDSLPGTCTLSVMRDAYKMMHFSFAFFLHLSLKH